MPPVVSSNLAIHDHVVDAWWIPSRVLVGADVSNGRGIENDEVGMRSLANDTTIGEAKLPGGKASHTMDRFFEREQPLVAGVGPEHLGEGAIESWMRFAFD